ncbi:hypothetical protein GCM10025858_22920 [Alicyclobacillus sacchari]|uniref:protease pro-enzyme activation domain-containing protein n=1 Tax=Alicyclobacillus sacchari TaxID=392010 RepID=UPI0023E99DD4|nr:protease pro-enzyme activation domain-containing protein [Alicyclobacillus sacchari]GMA57789.1 hypothetical protein GCM10025858_22920 [Alicyclobacillus sacchari]
MFAHQRAATWCDGSDLADEQARCCGYAEPEATRGAMDVGQLAANAPMHVAVGLKLRNQAALEQLIANLYNPSSSQFGHYVTPGQFQQEFAPTAYEVEAVRDYLRQYGLQVQPAAKQQHGARRKRNGYTDGTGLCGA